MGKNYLKAKIRMETLTRYIIDNGGHSAIETMPIISTKGWKKLEYLQRCVRNHKESGTPFQWPKWYRNYIAQHEKHVKLPVYMTSGSQEANELTIDSDHDLDVEPPTKMHCGDNQLRRIARESSPPGFNTHQLHAGPHHKHPYIASTSRKHQNQKYTSRNDCRTEESYPDRHPNRFSKQQKPDIESPDNRNMETASLQEPPYEGAEDFNEEDKDSDEERDAKAAEKQAASSANTAKFHKPLFDYILKAGGHAAIETMPINRSVKLWAKLNNLQNSLRNQRERDQPVFHYPQWYQTFLSIHEPDVAVFVPDIMDRMIFERMKKPVSHSLINYIIEQGGHAKIRSMGLDRKIQDWYMLSRLKECIEMQEKTVKAVVQYPLWYRQYLSQYEPSVKLPELPDYVQLEPDFPYIEEPCRPITSRDHPLVQYILQNGGHPAIRRMEVGYEFEGWRQLKRLKRRMTSNVSFTNYPEWYKKFILPESKHT